MEDEEWPLRTANVDRVETDGSDSNQDFVISYRRGGSFLENDLFSLKEDSFEVVRPESKKMLLASWTRVSQVAGMFSVVVDMGGWVTRHLQLSII